MPKDLFRTGDVIVTIGGMVSTGSPRPIGKSQLMKSTTTAMMAAAVKTNLFERAEIDRFLNTENISCLQKWNYFYIWQICRNCLSGACAMTRALTRVPDRQRSKDVHP
jgi:hypothetical protein